MIRSWIPGIAAMVLLIGSSWSVIHGAAATAPATARAPYKFTLALVMIAGTQGEEYIFVINNRVGFKTVDSLKEHIAQMPAGSTLTWDPGCLRTGGEPLLSSDKEMKAFQEFCTAHKIELVIIPSG